MGSKARSGGTRAESSPSATHVPSPKSRGMSRGAFVVVVAAIVLVSAGVAFSVLRGGAGAKAGIEVPGQEKLSLESAPTSMPLRPVSELTLPWGTADGVAIAESRLSALECAFAAEDGSIWVVDHDPGAVGARMRRYKDGKLAARHDAPGGSTLFASVGGRAGYIIAKGNLSAERVVLIDEQGSVEATYVVPLELNSGGLQWKDDTLYVTIWSGWVDPQTRVVNEDEVLVPIAKAGRQLTDQEAKDGMTTGWRFTEQGIWQHRNFMDPGTEESKTGTTTAELGFGDKSLEVPYDAFALGADDAGRAWLLYPPKRVTERVLPGWPALADDFALLVATDIEGDVAGVMPVRSAQGLAWPDFPVGKQVGFDGRFLTIADRTPAGVTFSTYEVTR